GFVCPVVNISRRYRLFTDNILIFREKRGFMLHWPYRRVTDFLNLKEYSGGRKIAFRSCGFDPIPNLSIIERATAGMTVEPAAGAGLAARPGCMRRCCLPTMFMVLNDTESIFLNNTQHSVFFDTFAGHESF